MYKNKLMKNLIILLIFASFFISCKDKKDTPENSAKQKDSLDIKSKELSLKERELELKQKELDLEKEKQEQNNQEKEEKKVSQENFTYNNYTNSRYGFSVSYPSNFTKDRPSENGDGQVFRSPDKKFELRAYASYGPSVSGMTIKEIYNENISNYEQVTYKVLKSNWFVLSGYNKGKIFYMKSFVGAEAQYTILMEYPISEKTKYDDRVTAITKSFKPGAM
jgi:hypothetical protein